jgi:DHA2 family multidrug resistance protein
VALPHIAGNLSVTQNQATWVLTSYLVANAIVLPMSGWLSAVLGRKRFYMMCIAGFGLSSLLCGMAPNLPMLIIFRTLQGLTGGGLQPSSQAILADSFPPAKRGMAFAAYGMAVVFAPAIGPTLGGWITDNFTWHWIFLINVPVSLLLFSLTQVLISDPEHVVAAREARRSRGIRLDYLGFALLALGLGGLQLMLDKGQEEDWFASHMITAAAVVAVVCLTTFVVREWYSEDPLVDLRLLRRPNFAIANVLMFMLGFILLGSTALLPLFVQSLLGYTAMDAGLVISPGGFLIMFMTPGGQSRQPLPDRLRPLRRRHRAVPRQPLHPDGRLLDHRRGPCGAGGRPRLPVHPDQFGGLCRHPAGAQQLRLGADQPVAQPGRQRRHRPAGHLAGPQRPGEPRPSGRPRLGL